MIALSIALLVLASADTPGPGEVGGVGLAIKSAKILTCAREGPGVVDRGVLLVRDGKIEAVGRARDIEVPAGYELVDVGDEWLMPGLIDLHSHVGAIELLLVDELNDRVFLTNPGLRAFVAARTDNQRLLTGLQAGVTTVLLIPGSGSNMGGWGVLLKTGHDQFEEMVLRNPGSLKVAQWGNPESWGPGVGKLFETYAIREAFTRGLAYARRWKAYEEQGGEAPLVDPEWEIFRHLLDKRTQVSVHTQMYQVVLKTITQIKGEFGVDVYLDHSEIGGWRAGALAQEMGVPAIIGPRNADTPSRGFMNWGANDTEGFKGLAQGFQEQGLEMIGFNTDSPIVPQHQLPVQAAIAVRLGFDDSEMAAVRGLTIVPAMAAGIADRVGSLEVGKDADIVVTSGHPADARSAVQRVWQDGVSVYDSAREIRRW